MLAECQYYLSKMTANISRERGTGMVGEVCIHNKRDCLLQNIIIRRSVLCSIVQLCPIYIWTIEVSTRKARVRYYRSVSSTPPAVIRKLPPWILTTIFLLVKIENLCNVDSKETTVAMRHRPMFLPQFSLHLASDSVQIFSQQRMPSCRQYQVKGSQNTEQGCSQWNHRSCNQQDIATKVQQSPATNTRGLKWGDLNLSHLRTPQALSEWIHQTVLFCTIGYTL